MKPCTRAACDPGRHGQPPACAGVDGWCQSLARARSWHAGVSLAVAAGVVPLLWRHTGAMLLLAWLTAYAGCVLWLALRRRAGGRESACEAAPSRPLFETAVCHAAFWGLLPLVTFASLGADERRSLSWLVLVVAVYGSVSVFSTPRAQRVFLGLALSPVAGAWVAWGSRQDAASFVFATAAVGALCLAVGSQFDERLRSGWRVARDKHGLTQQLELKNRLLQAAHQSKDRVLVTASREVRQPVHALGLLVERLLVDPQARLVHGQVDTIARVVRSLAHSLGLLRDLSQLEAGTVRPVLRSFGVTPMFERLVAENRLEALEKGLRMVHEAPLCTVRSDPRLLHGILSSFVSNAVRYTEHGSVSIAARREGDHLWIDVVDTGPGIPESMHREIFREYVRIDPENQSVHGFGLGLAIADRTARLLGLRLALASQPGQGSRFSVCVPLGEEPDDEPLLPGDESPAAAWQRSLAGRRGILVDPDPVVLAGLASMVGAWGCQVVVVRSCEELRARLDHLQSPPDFIIADFHLGTLACTGTDAIRMVRERLGPDVPAILLTADLARRPGEPTGQADIQVLHKPVMPARLRTALEGLLAAVPDTPAAAAATIRQADRAH